MDMASLANELWPLIAAIVSGISAIGVSRYKIDKTDEQVEKHEERLRNAEIVSAQIGVDIKYILFTVRSLEAKMDKALKV